MPSLNTGNAILSNAIAVNSTYNVGIGGAASGSHKLQVTGTTNVTGVLTLGSTISNGTYTYTLPSATGTIALVGDLSGYLPLSGGTLTGKLTINTGGIDNQLQVNGTAPSLRLTNAVTGATINGFVSMAGTVGDYILTSAVGDMCIGNQNNGKILFGFGAGTATLKMTITSAGNVGIGVNSPAGKLEINGLTFINNTGDTTARLLLRNTTTGASSGGLDIQEIGVDASLNNASNGYLSLSTNNTERLRISSAGIITAPSQVSFKAYFSGANPVLTKGVANTMPYNAEEYDVQGNFNTSTYKFTAPVAGKYLFIANVNMYGVNDAADVRIFLTINSSTNRLLFWRQNMATGNTGDCNFSGSDILNLASGNTVEIKIYTDGSGTFNVSSTLDYNSFSGHLLG